MLDDRSLKLFLSGFTARDITEPLVSFDESTPLVMMCSAVESRQLEAVGIRKDGLVAGWLAREDIFAEEEPKKFRPIGAEAVLADTASLDQVIGALHASSCMFVRILGEIGGLICRRDTQKPAMRMWLFGLVTISEMRVTRMIDEYCPQDSWTAHISEGRLQKARELQEERRRRGQAPSLLDCLQFADKGRIVARYEKLQELTRFSSKREVEKFVASLESLRNNLAHSQDLAQDWEVIHELATHLHRIVLGPTPQ